MKEHAQISQFATNNQSTNKVLAIMEFLSYSKEPLRLIDIADGLNYNTSTTLRFLNSLEQNGYVYKNPHTLKYQMTYKLCGLANQINRNSNLVEISMTPIKQLSARLKECVCLAVEQDDSIIYIYAVDGPQQMLRTTKRIGSQAPMHCTGVGKMILSEFSTERIQELISRKGLEPYTDHTIVSADALLTELQTIRRRGYAYDNEECELGARCIAFPIRNYSGRMIAALSVTGPVCRITDAFIDANFRTILETVQDISYQLGYHK